MPVKFFWLPSDPLSQVLFVHGTIPRPSAFTVRLSHGLGMQLRVGQQAADNRSSGSVRRTGAIVAKRRSVRFTCSTSKGPGVRHAIHRQGMLQCIVYCNKEHSHQAPVSYIQVGISRTQDQRSFHHGTLQRPGHSLGLYTCPVTTMPQQS